MEIVRIACIGVICAIACLLLKDQRPELALLISIAGGVMILLSVVGIFSGVLDSVRNIVTLTGLNADVFSSVLKMIGIGYVAEFGAGICEEAGNKSLGEKIVLCGKVLILAMSLPIIASLMKILVDML